MPPSIPGENLSAWIEHGSNADQPRKCGGSGGCSPPPANSRGRVPPRHPASGIAPGFVSGRFPQHHAGGNPDLVDRGTLPPHPPSPPRLLSPPFPPSPTDPPLPPD